MFTDTIRKYVGETFGIVLRKKDNGEYPCEYVTHEFRVDTPNGTYWGHYFWSLEEAMEDYYFRVAKLRGC